jgi:CheY-like chemotaxis protein
VAPAARHWGTFTLYFRAFALYGERVYDRSEPPGEPRRILYYADPRFPSGLLAELESRGYVLEPAQSGVELLDRAVRERPVQVIAFCRMPGVDGLSLCRKLKQYPGSTGVPLVVLSMTAEDPQPYLEAGCDAFYEAPFDEAAIAQRVDALVLDRSEARKLSLSRFAIERRSNPDAFSVNAQDLEDATLFLHSKNPLEEGSSLKLTLAVAGRTVVDAHGVVIRSEPFRGFSARPTGMAIRFDDLDASAEAFLEALIRQHVASGKSWQEGSVELFVDRIAAQVQPGAEPVRVDPLLRRAGFVASELRPWEVAAFAFEDEGPGVGRALREALGVLYKIRHHLALWRQTPYLSSAGYERFRAHAEQLLSRAEAAGDALAALADRLAAGGDEATGDQLLETQGDLLHRRVELRTAMADARRSTEATSPPPADEVLLPEEEIRALDRGLTELFDFVAGGPLKPDARGLNPELDLGELSDFEIACFMEARAHARAIHPAVSAWTRALAARHLHFAEFLRYRRPGREVRPDRVAEVLQFGARAFEGLFAVEERYRAELPALAGAGVPSAHLTELTATNQRLLLAAARFCEYHNLHAEAGSVDYGPLIAAAASAAAAVLPPPEGLPPVSVGPAPGTAPSEKLPAGAAPEAAGSAPAPSPAARPGALSRALARVREWFGDLAPKRRRLLAGAVVLALAGGGAAAGYLALTSREEPEKPRGPSAVNAALFSAIVPVTRCDLRDAATEKGMRKTLRCIVRDDWTKRPQPERKSSLKKLFDVAREKGLQPDQILLLDSREDALGYMDGEEIEVFDR